MRRVAADIVRYYGRAISIFVREPAFRALALAALFALLLGTVFYRLAEGWSWVDSFYFSMVTLATVGYGDFAPTSDFTRIVTVFYILFGFGVVATFLSVLVRAPLLMSGAITPQTLRLPAHSSTTPPPATPKVSGPTQRHYAPVSRHRRRRSRSSRGKQPSRS